jgi:hypothetical protein
MNVFPNIFSETLCPFCVHTPWLSSRSCMTKYRVQIRHRGAQYGAPPRPIHRLGKCWLKHCMTSWMKWRKYCLSHIAGRWRSNQLATGNNTQIFKESFLVDAFGSSVWSIMIPNIGLSGAFDYITSKMGLDGKQDATNNLGFNVNPIANFQPATRVSRFKMLNALVVVRVPVLSCVMLYRLSNPNNQKGDNSVCGPSCTMSITCSSSSTSLFLEAQNVGLHLEKCFSRRWSSTGANARPRVICRRHPVDISQQQQCRCCHYKTTTQNVYTWILRGQTARIQLLIAAHCSQQELTAVYAISRTAGVVILHEHVHVWAHRLRFNYNYSRNSYKSQPCSHDTWT